MGSLPSAKPLISVIVAVVHRGDLAGTVAALARQTLPPSAFEVVIVDGLRIEDWPAQLPEVVRAAGRPLPPGFGESDREVVLGALPPDPGSAGPPR